MCDNKKAQSLVEYIAGQSTLEFAILIVTVAVALLATQGYIKRAVQGRLKSTTDDVGEQFSTAGNLYITESSSSNSQESVGLSGAGVQESLLVDDARTTRNEVFNLGQANAEYWGM